MVALTPLHWSQIAPAIGTLMRQALGTGPQIYPFIRWTNDQSQYTSLFGRTDKRFLNPWFITREGGGDVRGGDPNGRQLQVGFGEVARTHHILIEGFYAMKGDGSTQNAFDDQVDLVCDLLNQELTTNSGSVFLTSPRFTPTVLEKFGPALCHTSSITLDAIVRVAANYVQG